MIASCRWALLSLLAVVQGQTDTYVNPVVNANSPDPGVLAVPGEYVAVTSTGYAIETNIFPIRVSTDLAHWKEVGFAFPGSTHPSWAAAPFYAPEIHAVRMPNKQTLADPDILYWLVFDATEVNTGLMVVGAAWSSNPRGPFTDIGSPIMRGIGGTNATAIDATLWQNKTDKSVYLLFKNKHDGIRQIILQEFRPVMTLSPAIIAVGEPQLLLSATESWEVTHSWFEV
jgi:beta-xylosidase